MVRAEATDPPPLLSARYAARGTHFAMYFNTGTLPFALCHLHSAIFTLPFCRPQRDPESASDSTRVRGFLTKWSKMDPKMDPSGRLFKRQSPQVAAWSKGRLPQAQVHLADGGVPSDHPHRGWAWGHAE